MNWKMLMIALAMFVFATPIFAQTTGGTPVNYNWVPVSAAVLAMAIASAGCALGQGRAVSGAAEGIARNPGAAAAIRFALILGLVLIESLALYTLVIIVLKVPNV